LAVGIRFRRRVLAAASAASMLEIEAIARQSGRHHICDVLVDMKDGIRVGSPEHGVRKLPGLRPNYCIGVAMTNWMFDGEGLEFSHLQRFAAMQKQGEMLKEAKRMREALERQGASHNKQSCKCPHCGGEMPSDAAQSKYARHQCGGEIYWMDQKPYKSQQDAHAAAGWDTDDDEDWDDDDDDDVAAARKPSASNSQLMKLGTCIYACALLVAADGKVTPREAEIVVDGLSWSGLEGTELKQKFVKACKRVRKEGETKWVQIVTKTLAEDNNEVGAGMPKHGLRDLLTRLVNAEAADSQQKQGLFNSIQAGFASSSSAAKPVRGIRNPFTGEIQ